MVDLKSLLLYEWTGRRIFQSAKKLNYAIFLLELIEY